MLLCRNAVAGTLESSDILISIEPKESGIEIELQSTVYDQFGESIKAAIYDEAKRLKVEGAHIIANDHGALDCTIRARVETAIKRAAKKEEEN